MLGAHTASGVAVDAREGFRSVLAAVDLTAAVDTVIRRVELLPFARHAKLTLLHVVPRTLATSARRTAVADALGLLEAVVPRIAARLPHVDVEWLVTVGATASEIANQATTRSVQLIVTGRGPSRVFRDTLLGSTAERVLRRAQLPLLVTRPSHGGHYQRPAVAVALDHTDPRTIAALLQLVPPPRPGVVLLHACDVPHYAKAARSLGDTALEQYLEQVRQRATHDIRLLVKRCGDRDGARGRPPMWTIRVSHGAPRTVIERAATDGAHDLLVLGTRGYTGAARAVMGSIAGDVLRATACDVLVVPSADA